MKKNVIIYIITLLICIAKTTAQTNNTSTQKKYSIQIMRCMENSNYGFINKGIFLSLSKHFSNCSAVRLSFSSNPELYKSYRKYEPDENDYDPYNRSSYKKGVQISLGYVYSSSIIDKINLYLFCGPFYNDLEEKRSFVISSSGTDWGESDVTGIEKMYSYGIFFIIGFEYFISKKISFVSEFGISISNNKSQDNVFTISSGEENNVPFYDEYNTYEETENINLSTSIKRFGLSIYF